MTWISPRERAGFRIFAAFMRALCVARANQVVHLVDDKDDVAELS